MKESQPKETEKLADWNRVAEREKEAAEDQQTKQASARKPALKRVKWAD